MADIYFTGDDFLVTATITGSEQPTSVTLTIINPKGVTVLNQSPMSITTISSGVYQAQATYQSQESDEEGDYKAVVRSSSGAYKNLSRATFSLVNV